MNHSAKSELFQEELYFFTTPVIVVLSRPWAEYEQEEQMLLRKILTSVKVDMKAIQVVSQPSLALKSLTSFSPARVLIFGSETDEEIISYQLTPAQGFTVIKADDLPQLDDSKKKDLWIALRKMFGV